MPLNPLQMEVKMIERKSRKKDRVAYYSMGHLNNLLKSINT